LEDDAAAEDAAEAGAEEADEADEADAEPELGECMFPYERTCEMTSAANCTGLCALPVANTDLAQHLDVSANTERNAPHGSVSTFR